MKTNLISKENSRAKFEITFSGEEFEAAVQKAYQAQKNRFNVPGFRRGKATRRMIENYYGEGVFWEDAVDDLIGQNYGNAIEELNLEVIDQPDLELSKLEKGKDFTVTFDVDVYPDVEVKDYLGINVTKEEEKISDADIDLEIEMLQKRNARLVLVDRPIKEFDEILLDYEGSVDGVPFEGGKAERYDLKVGSGTFIPGFEEQLIGLSAGDEKDVEVTFPEDYHQKDLAGKPAVFHCVIHEVKEEQLPEADDDFAKDVSEYDTIDEFRQKTRERLEKEAADRDLIRMKNSCLEQVFAANDIAVPDSMVRTEIDSMISEFDQQLRSQGLSMDDYFKYTNKTKEDFAKEYDAEARRKVKTRLIVRAIADKENITVSPEEVEKEIENMAEQYGVKVDEIRGMIGEENLKYIEADVRMTKAVDYVFEKANFIEKAAEEAKAE